MTARIFALFWTLFAAWNGYILRWTTDRHSATWVEYVVIIVLCLVMNGWVNYSSIRNQGKSAAYQDMTTRLEGLKP